MELTQGEVERTIKGQLKKLYQTRVEEENWQGSLMDADILAQVLVKEDSRLSESFVRSACDSLCEQGLLARIGQSNVFVLTSTLLRAV